jgi:hypothetical protein
MLESAAPRKKTNPLAARNLPGLFVFEHHRRGTTGDQGKAQCKIQSAHGLLLSQMARILILVASSYVPPALAMGPASGANSVLVDAHQAGDHGQIVRSNLASLAPAFVSCFLAVTAPSVA